MTYTNISITGTQTHSYTIDTQNANKCCCDRAKTVFETQEMFQAAFSTNVLRNYVCHVRQTRVAVPRTGAHVRPHSHACDVNVPTGFAKNVFSPFRRLKARKPTAQEELRSFYRRRFDECAYIKYPIRTWPYTPGRYVWIRQTSDFRDTSNLNLAVSKHDTHVMRRSLNWKRARRSINCIRVYECRHTSNPARDRISSTRHASTGVSRAV